MRLILFLIPVCFLTACHCPYLKSKDGAGERPEMSLAQLVKKAGEFNNVVTIPIFETSPQAVEQSIGGAIADGDAALDVIGGVDSGAVTFENTIGALDDLAYEAGLVANRVYLMKETSTDATVREAATEGIKRFEEWSVGLDYREDVYRAVQAYASTQPALSGEKKKLLEETLRDYRRAGLHLARPQREEVERMRKELSSLSTDFDSNITKAKAALIFSREALAGVPESFFGAPGVKTGDDEYTVMANITWHFIAVMENAREEETRRKVKLARYSLAREENVELLTRILKLRRKIALALGYASWADYQIEPKMAQTGARATEFLENLNEGLQPKLESELEAYRQIKVRDTGDPDVVLRLWDYRYYRNQLKKEKYTVDTEQLREFFPYEQVLEGMFGIFERIFGLEIWPVEPPQKWVDDLEMYAVSDAVTGEPMGLFYLDMFPREGKFNHFAQFGIIEGKRLVDGRYQRPTVALICNFPAAQADQPSLLSHSEVETLFHEFGHAMHSILTRADYVTFSGTSVPRDFVEAPSQMLENWVWDKTVLDGFAASYKDPERKIPQEILDKLKEAKQATIATHYRRQISFGLLDLALHAGDPETYDVIELSNGILEDVFMEVPEGTTFVTYFGHLTGYDAGYYGYAWADAIAADMATVFEQAPDRYEDREIGMRLRHEIYAPGNSRDVNESIEKFLGRERSIAPFLKTLGMEE